METDRELLEMAAEAVGIVGRYVEDDKWDGDGIIYTDGHDCNQCWNPLVFDGDAFRLALALGFHLVNDRHNRRAICEHEEVHYDESKFGGTCDAAGGMRRAIVLAAAEIGRKKQMTT